jgi:hypothetical protein
MESFVHPRNGRTPRATPNSTSTTPTIPTSRRTARSSWLDTDGLESTATDESPNGSKQKLADLKAEGRPDDEFGFVVHGTMADPRWLDPAVDPNVRTPGTCYLGDPRVVNDSPVGLARFCTLRSWLSQWSYDDANGDAVDCGPDIAVPVLVIGNLADDACTPSHTGRLFEAVGHPDKEMREIEGANHYYWGPDQRGTLREAVGVCTDWLHRHGFSR